MMKTWIIGVMLAFFCYSCNNSEGSPRELAHFQQDKQEKKDKKDKSKKEDKGNKSKKKEKTGKSDNAPSDAAGSVRIEQAWELPAVLTEVSGTAWYDTDKIAAVQDESGIIFIYDLRTKKISREIHFAGKGDYEGIAVKDNSFYVLRSDGTIIEVDDSGKSSEHKTHLTIKNDTEGLFLDRKSNRLLVALKAADAAHPGKKNIYAFDLGSKKLSDQPVISIDANDPALGGKSKKDDKLQPSDIAVHPSTGDVYVTDGANPALLVISSDGKIKERYTLDRSLFPQPEGITFAPGGTLYISSEGVKGNGKIMKVNIDSTDQLNEGI
jgi:uncharacterized protein YjiK